MESGPLRERQHISARLGSKCHHPKQPEWKIDRQSDVTREEDLKIFPACPIEAVRFKRIGPLLPALVDLEADSHQGAMMHAPLRPGEFERLAQLATWRDGSSSRDCMGFAVRQANGITGIMHQSLAETWYDTHGIAP